MVIVKLILFLPISYYIAVSAKQSIVFYFSYDIVEESLNQGLLSNIRKLLKRVALDNKS